jgi:hypothetical protein
MNNFPVLAGNEPRATGVRMLPYGLSHINLKAIFTLQWLREQNVPMAHKYEFDPVLVLRRESSHTRCSLVQIRWMLYAFPFGLRFASVNSSKKAGDIFHEMYALPASRYAILYMNLGDVELTSNNRAEMYSHIEK